MTEWNSIGYEPAPAPDTSDYKMETIREGAPPRLSRPRRAHRNSFLTREEVGPFILLVALCMLAGLIGGFLGTVLGNLW